MHDNQETRAKILLWRSKLNSVCPSRLGAAYIQMAPRHQNALHEYTFKGRWPEERYQALQVAVSDLLALMAQLRHVYLQLDRPWRKALLERTRLNDLRFLGHSAAIWNGSATDYPQPPSGTLCECSRQTPADSVEKRQIQGNTAARQL
jgi:hypothetical protein